MKEEYFREIISEQIIKVTTNGLPWCPPSTFELVTKEEYEEYLADTYVERIRAGLA